jgi:hypothetical protein
VGVLKEFLPANHELLGLNVNHGQSISIRLRKSRNDLNSFFPYEDLLGTMLHEMVHIGDNLLKMPLLMNYILVKGPHDAQFYKMLDELKHECEILMSQGISYK